MKNKKPKQMTNFRMFIAVLLAWIHNGFQIWSPQYYAKKRKAKQDALDKTEYYKDPKLCLNRGCANPCPQGKICCSAECLKQLRQAQRVEAAGK